MRRAAIVAGACLYVLSAPREALCQDAQEKGSTISLRILPIRERDERMKLWKEIDKLAKPQQLLVPANHSVAEAVREQCGNALDDLVDVVREKNPAVNLDPTESDRTLAFIPCPYWILPEGGNTPSVKVRKGEVLDHILRASTGESGPITVDKVRSLNPDMIGPAGEITKSGFLKVPYVVRSLHIPVSTPVTKAEATALAAPVVNVLPPPTRAVVEKHEVQISESTYSHVGEEAPPYDDPGAECGGPDSRDAWPYDMAAIHKAFLEVQATFSTRPPQPTLLIADTGLDVSTPALQADPILQSNLWRNMYIENGVASPWATFVGDRYGASMVTRNGQIAPTQNYRLAAHGTYIARILLEPAFRVPNTWIPRLAIAKLNDEQPPYAIGLNSVPEAFSYARNISAGVMNLSVVIGAAVGALKDALRDPAFVVVSAAGNSGRPLDELKIYPPTFDDSYRAKLIVVGALDWNNHRATFSNYGTAVDILAPGCAIPIRMGADFAYVSGTSFAAPFVAYTAALLQSLLIPVEEIKTRIVTSGDYDPLLVAAAKNGIRLNIERAVRIRDDSITLQRGGGTILYGDLDPMQIWTCKVAGSPRPFNPQQVFKIVPGFHYSRGHEIFTIWKRSAGSVTPVELVCDEIDGHVQFKAQGEATYTAYNWNEVVDVVPRIRRQVR